jgi:hypothetical protein
MPFSENRYPLFRGMLYADGGFKLSIKAVETFPLKAGASMKPMAKQRIERGTRKSVRIDLRTPGFLIPAPDAPWIECEIVDVSDKGVCLEVGDLAMPKLFGLALTARGEVLRICSLIWRRGERVGARFVSAKELRQDRVPAAPKPDRHAG